MCYHEYFPEVIKDYLNNVTQSILTGELQSQFYDAFMFLNDAVTKYGASNVTQIGQSLGGLCSESLGALKQFKDVKTITYNSVGAGNLLDALSSFGELSNDFSNIYNYRYSNEMVTTIAPHIGTVYTSDYICDNPNSAYKVHNMEVYIENNLTYNVDNNFTSILDEILYYPDISIEFELLNGKIIVVLYTIEQPGSIVLDAVKTTIKNIEKQINIIALASNLRSPIIEGYISVNEYIYTIKSGDTIWNICQKYELTEATIRQLNPWLNDRYTQDGKYVLIKPGETIVLPNDKMEKYINNNSDMYDSYNNSISASPIASDPLLIDLNNDGIKTTSINNGQYIDHQADGFAEKSAWVSNEDGILFIDKNNNGKIDSGRELFGENYIKSNNTTATNGIDALADLDSNNDGIIDINDTDFNNIKIQKGDGTQLTLSEAGISSISLSEMIINNLDENNNTQTSTAIYTRTNGTTGEIGSFNLQVNYFDSQAIEEVEVSAEVELLPNIRSFGRMYDLHQAIMRDLSGELKTLVQSFISETNDTIRVNLVEQILLKWSNSENIAVNANGDNINAKHLHVLESFMGKDFYSTYTLEHNDGNRIPENPNKQAGDILNTIYEKFSIYVYAELVSQSNLSNYFNNINFELNLDDYSISCNFDNIVQTLSNEIAQNELTGKEHVYQVAKMIKGLGLDTQSNFFDPKDDSCFYTTFTKDDRNLKWLIDSIGKVPYTDELGDGECTAADDALIAENGQDTNFHALSGDDVMYGASGNDSFAACNGDDIVDGGAGNDYLDGHGGNDTIWGGAGNDMIHAGEGDDIVLGGEGDDMIYPDHNDDFGFSATGDDIVRGGTGDDTIISVSGNDTFIFNLGDGQDTIYEYQGVDTLYFGENIDWEDLTFTRSYDDMIITIDGADDSITVKDWFSLDTNVQEPNISGYDNHKIEVFEFADGSKHYMSEISIENTEDYIAYDMQNYGYLESVGNYSTEISLQEGWNEVHLGENSINTIITNENEHYAFIQNSTSADTIRFASTVLLDNTYFNMDETTLNIWMGDINSSLDIVINNGNVAGNFKFDDGTIITDISDYLSSDVSYYDYIMGQRMETLRLLGSEDISVVGNGNDNAIISNYGDLTVEAGGGNDYIESMNSGNDTYIFNLWDGQDYITDFGGTDTIQFGEGITVSSLRLTKNLDNNDLEIRFYFEDDEEGRDDCITIANYFGSNDNKIESFVFADETVISNVDSYINVWASEGSITLPSTVSEAHLRGDGHTSATGTSSGNWIAGNDGDNSITAGQGDDGIDDGNRTNERYYYNLGDGDDTISDYGGLDAIIFGTGITQAMLSFDRDNDDLVISIGNNGSIRVQNYFGDDENKIELIQFSDGSIIDNLIITETLNGTTITVGTAQGSSILTANQANATLTGSGDAYVLGTSAANTVTGNSGDNTYALGGGDDTVSDTLGGNDTYLFNVNNGNDVITDTSGTDTIKFGKYINPDNLKFEQKDNGLLISLLDSEGSLFIAGYYTDNNHKIENFVFEDGTTLDGEDIADRITGVETSTNYVMDSETIVDTVRMGGTGNISVEGNDENNIIYGNNGNNTFQGDGGDDTLIDSQGGNDTYVYNLGDGVDTIDDLGGTDTIRFGQGITTENVEFKKTPEDLEIWFTGEEGGLIIKNYYTNANNQIERFEFADNTVITNVDAVLKAIASDTNINLSSSLIEQAYLWGEGNTNVIGNALDNYIMGNSGNNTITGGLGDDYLKDEEGGNDTYIYNLGDGEDTIDDNSGYDTIQFGANIASENLIFIRHYNDLVINFQNALGEHINGGIRIGGYFDDYNKRIEKIQFSDQSYIIDLENRVTKLVGDEDYLANDWDYPEVIMIGEADGYIRGSYAAETIIGNEGDNTYDPQGGNDTIIDTEGGDDTYIYNHDYENKNIIDIGGDDTMRFGSAIDIENTRFIQDGDDLKIYFTNLGNPCIQISGYFEDNDHKIESFEFADETVLTDLTNYINGTASENSITIASNYTDGYLKGSSNASVTGNSSDNIILGNSGDNTYNAGAGDDRIEDKAGGDDTYIYNDGDGYDWIVDIGGDDTLRFGNGITTENVSFMNVRNNLQIFIDTENHSGGITIEGYFRTNAKKIESFVFADNTVITNVTPYLTGITVTGDYTLPENSPITDLYLNGTENSTIIGNSSNTYIEGNSGNNTYQGNEGDDNIYDGEGNETYIYNLGDGYDFINDRSGYDTIRFGQGITANMIRMERTEEGHLAIFFDGEDGGITVCDYFNDDNAQIEKIVLYDETEYTDFTPFMPYVVTSTSYTLPENTFKRDIIAIGDGDITLTGNSQDNYIQGNEGDNTYEGAGGNDYIESTLGGDDVYIYNLGDGWDTINEKNGYDTVRFGAGLNVSDMRVMTRNGEGLEIWFDGIEGNLVIEDFFNAVDDKAIERFEFDDNTVITDITQYINCIASDGNITLPTGYREAHLWGDGNTSATGNSGNNHFNGNSGDNTFTGGQGDDSYWDDQGGDDTYIYNLGDGWDTIYNEYGYDTIRFGQGITTSNIIMSRDEWGNLNITFDSQDGGIQIQNYFNNDDCKIERIILSDNTVITNFTPYYNWVETDTSYTVLENAAKNNVVATGDANVTLTGNSQENLLIGNEGNNTFEGKGGDDTFAAIQGGNDTYIYNLGDGYDFINDYGGNDKIHFGQGITQNDLRIMRDDYNNVNVQVMIENAYGGILLNNQLNDVESTVETIEFNDNTTINVNSSINKIGSEFNDIVLPTGYLDGELWGSSDLSITGNSLDNWLGGNDGDNTIEGGAGDDSIYDPSGDDTYVYNVGDGDDYIADFDGIDTLSFGTGITTQNIIFSHQSGNDNLVITFNGINGSITIEDYFSGTEDKAIETFLFSDDSVITDISSICQNAPQGNGLQPELMGNGNNEPDGLEPLDINQLIQEINAYGVDDDIIMTNAEPQNNDELMLVMS